MPFLPHLIHEVRERKGAVASIKGHRHRLARNRLRVGARQRLDGVSVDPAVGREHAVIGAVGRDLGALKPGLVGELEEVIARIELGVHAGDVKTEITQNRRILRKGGRCGGERDERNARQQVFHAFSPW